MRDGGEEYIKGKLCLFVVLYLVYYYILRRVVDRVMFKLLVVHVLSLFLYYPLIHISSLLLFALSFSFLYFSTLSLSSFLSQNWSTETQ